MTQHKRILLSLFILFILADQILKVYIKTHFVLGQEINLLGTWCKFHFIENDGMAYGLKFSDGAWAKITLTLFRLFATIYGMYYVLKYIFPKNNKLLNFTVTLILAGAIGNLIDSIFYGIIFTQSPTIYEAALPATFSLQQSYGHLLQGKVVDMIYCPIIRTILPTWVPIWGGKPYEFFSPIFNFADACISTGVGILIIFYKHFFKEKI